MAVTTIIGVRYDESAGGEEACFRSYEGVTLSRFGRKTEVFYTGEPQADYMTALLVQFYRNGKMSIMASSSVDNFAVDAGFALCETCGADVDLGECQRRAVEFLEERGETDAVERAMSKPEWTLENLPDTCSLKVEPWDGRWRATLNFCDDDADCLSENGDTAGEAIRRVLEAAREAKPVLFVAVGRDRFRPTNAAGLIALVSDDTRQLR